MNPLVFRTDLMSLPFQAIECYLAHVQPIDGKFFFSFAEVFYVSFLFFFSFCVVFASPLHPFYDYPSRNMAMG